MRKISTIFVFLLVLAGFTTSAFAAGNRSKIDKFFKSYEEMVVQAEKAAKSNKTSDLIKLSAKAADLANEYAKLEDTSDWTDKDTIKYVELSNRYAKATVKMSSNSLGGLGGFSF